MAFDKNRSSTWVILILVLINIATLATLWMGPRRQAPAPPLTDMWKQELDLSNEQAHGFQKQVQIHRKTIQPLFHQMSETKQQLIQALSGPKPDTLLAHQLADSTAAIQRRLDLQLAEHYLALRALCTPEQVEQLNHIFLQTLHAGPGRPHPGGPPPPRHR